MATSAPGASAIKLYHPGGIAWQLQCTLFGREAHAALRRELCQSLLPGGIPHHFPAGFLRSLSFHSRNHYGKIRCAPFKNRAAQGSRKPHPCPIFDNSGEQFIINHSAECGLQGSGREAKKDCKNSQPFASQLRSHARSFRTIRCGSGRSSHGAGSVDTALPTRCPILSSSIYTQLPTIYPRWITNLTRTNSNNKTLPSICNEKSNTNFMNLIH